LTPAFFQAACQAFFQDPIGLVGSCLYRQYALKAPSSMNPIVLFEIFRHQRLSSRSADLYSAAHYIRSLFIYPVEDFITERRSGRRLICVGDEEQAEYPETRCQALKPSAQPCATRQNLTNPPRHHRSRGLRETHRSCRRLPTQLACRSQAIRVGLRRRPYPRRNLDQQNLLSCRNHLPGMLS
jgi:hypothetical protein